MHRPGIRTRLILILTAILCVAFLATSVANYHVSRRTIHEEIVTSSLPLTRDNIHSEIRGDLMRPVFISSTMANDAFLKQWIVRGEQDVSQITKYLKDIRDKYGFMSAFFVSARTLRYYYYKGVHKIISPKDDHDVWYYRFVSLNKEYDLDVDTDEAAEDRLTIFINFRVEDDDGTLLGVTGVGLEMDTLAALLRSYQDKYGRTIYMTDPSGRVQLHSDPAVVERMSIRDMEGLAGLVDLILTGRPEPVNVESERQGRRLLLTARYMPQIGWYLIVEQEERGALAAIRSNLVRNLAVGFAAIVIVLAVVVFTVNRFQSRLERMTVTDELTGVANRRAFEEQFEKAAYRCKRTGEPFCVILLDLDGFKAVNDRLGHLEGDRLLKTVTGLVRPQIRLTDLLARWGGDEFIVLVDGEQEQAVIVAERIRRAVGDAALGVGRKGGDPSAKPVTVSLGVSSFSADDALDALIGRADRALYTAKSEGGNAVRIA